MAKKIKKTKVVSKKKVVKKPVVRRRKVSINKKPQEENTGIIFDSKVGISFYILNFQNQYLNMF